MSFQGNSRFGVRICRGLLLTLLAVLGLTGCGGADNKTKSAKSADFAPAEMAPVMQWDANEETQPEPANREEYDDVKENEFLTALDHPLSTFSIDVDTASYSNVRRMLNGGQLPPRGAVRVEEFINYFNYEYPQPEKETPFSVDIQVADCPWKQEHQLLRIALQGKTFEPEQRPPCNLVFLLDVSGSMASANKLPLVSESMKLVLRQLDSRDRIAIVTYAGNSGVALPSTPANDRAAISGALSRLRAKGSTNGAGGIEAAYRVAKQNFISDGVNRVILCTDGDFNVGPSSRSELVDMIQQKAKSGIYLSVFGFGTGNYRDATMESLADKGNGNYAYIDTMLEAKKALVDQLAGTLITIAKDVKIQVDFNPQHVTAYRLIGYENRVMANEDFADDTKDAGEIGAGHRVTALYEIVPAGAESPATTKAQSEFVEPQQTKSEDGDTMLVVHLRYKEPDGDTSTELEFRQAAGTSKPFTKADPDFQFASSVAMLGMLLRKSKHAGDADMEWVISTAKSNEGSDPHGFRREFVMLAQKAKRLSD